MTKKSAEFPRNRQEIRAFFWLAPRCSLREARVAGGNLRIVRP